MMIPESVLVCLLAAGLCVLIAGSAATFSIRNVLALLLGLAIGLPIAAGIVSHSNAKHARDHDQIVRAQR